MDITALFWRIRVVETGRLLMIIGVAIIVVISYQCLALSHGNRWSNSPSDEEVSRIVLVFQNTTSSKNMESSEVDVFYLVENSTNSLYLEKEIGTDYELLSEKDAEHELILRIDASQQGRSSTMEFATTVDDSSAQAKAKEFGNGIQLPALRRSSTNNWNTTDRDSGRSDLSFPANLHSVGNFAQTMQVPPENMQAVPATLKKTSTSASASMLVLKRWEKQTTSISQMNLLLLQSLPSFHSSRPQWSSARDRELLSAKLGILNAPILRDTPGLLASVFRNVSMFKRSYELMERLLKVYVYKEGEKPIFHQSNMRGIYASEGWFMKLVEGNKKFVVRDPRKAHLFYLPFSSQMLRGALHTQNLQSQKDLGEYLKKYVDLVSQKYNFWNRTGGSDHFLVGCHDWAPRITRQHMSNCIRALCNANIATGFRIGKDTSLPVTSIRSAEAPLKDLGGKPPSERPILAFFAGGMHGYLRPILLQYWENKEPDMKIFGQLPRDLDGKRMYREYMKSSKYCLCARGYEVHTPRVVEAIFYECVPVIISDNYVPPFFEILNWEAFAVFIQEKDIPNLRNILLSIPEEKYVAMQLGVKMVQKHFLWHKKPVKYDLFHMILHSVWYNRVFQMKSR